MSAYQYALEQQGFVADAAQARAVQALQQCHEALHQGRTAVPGVYLWGAVGRGKTWLMDQFYQSLRVPARRQHFHHFMGWVHQRSFQLTGIADPLQALARELAEEVRVLCFDELFVNDIGDAIILGRLFQVMFDQGVVLVCTSNQPRSSCMPMASTASASFRRSAPSASTCRWWRWTASRITACTRAPPSNATGLAPRGSRAPWGRCSSA